ncbi:MAG: hypothetical protein SFU86_23120 [Pirellulaceae bacterium]|nr:hypothetical protein [Pirellulaceae bacterium]
MKRTLSLLVVALASTQALAQEPPLALDAAPAVTLAAPVASGQQQPLASPSHVTPEMWLYSQEQQRHDDPAMAVRRKAEYRSAQRMQRLASQKWFGMSNSRPQAGTTPMMGVYSPAWIGNGYDRYDWIGVSWPSNTLLIENVIQR